MVERDTVRQGYDELAAAYAAERSPREDERTALAEFSRALPADARLLDAGCGEGTPTVHEEYDPHSVVGLDISREQLRRARANDPGRDHAQADLTALPLTDSSVDAVTALHSVIHVPRGLHQQVVDEFARVLRPGGHLLVSEGPSEWHGRNPDWLDGGAAMEWHIAGAERTREQLRTAGFTVTDEWTTGDELAGEDLGWVFFAAELDG
jgi:SAM-dependent methyltransferase